MAGMGLRRGAGGGSPRTWRVASLTAAKASRARWGGTGMPAASARARAACITCASSPRFGTWPLATGTGLPSASHSATRRSSHCPTVSPSRLAASTIASRVRTDRLLMVHGAAVWGLGSKRTENLCKAVSRNLSRRLALLRHTFATEKRPACLDTVVVAELRSCAAAPQPLLGQGLHWFSVRLLPRSREAG